MIHEKILLKITKWLLILSLLTPLIVMKQFYFPYIVPKTLIFQALIELSLFSYILLVISNKAYLPRLDALTKSVLTFFGIYTVAAIFGEDLLRSFFGNFERMLGVVNLAHFVALFLIAKSVFVSNKDWILAFRYFIFAGFLVSIYAVFQKMGLTFVYNTGTNRIDATIGNAAFFAAYMIFNSFFAIFLIIKDKSNFKYFYGISLFLSLLTLYLSSTRGAILGTLVAFIFLGFALLFKKRANIKNIFSLKNNITKGILVSVAIVALSAWYSPNAFMDPINRISSISLSDTTTNTRILSAGVSWQGVKEQPILGWGPENYNLVFDKYYDPRLYPAENWFDHAHNIIFDTLVSSGFIGLVSYMSVFAILIYLLLKYSKKDEESYTVAYLFLALLLAYFLQNMFVFDALATYLPFFLLMAFIVFISSEDREYVALKRANIPVQAIVLLVVVFGSSMYYFNARPAMSAYYGIQALRYPLSQSDVSMDYFKKSLDFAIQGKPEIRSQAIAMMEKLFKEESVPDQQKIDFFNFTKEEARKSIEESPKDFRFYSYFATLMFLDSNNTEFLNEMKILFDEASKLAPNKPPLYLTKYQISSFLGDRQEAVVNLEKALDLYFDFNLSVVLGKNYSLLGDNKKAIEIYDSLLAREDKTPQQIVNIALELASIGEGERAIQLAEEVIKIQGPTDDALQFIENVRSGKFNK